MDNYCAMNLVKIIAKYVMEFQLNFMSKCLEAEQNVLHTHTHTQKHSINKKWVKYIGIFLIRVHLWKRFLCKLFQSGKHAGKSWPIHGALIFLGVFCCFLIFSQTKFELSKNEMHTLCKSWILHHSRPRFFTHHHWFGFAYEKKKMTWMNRVRFGLVLSVANV